ncbi:MAG: trypsin-like peptidase domain-containing protein, partial [Bacillota bacterium]|nr:trypsin-like peptidase domain-containing protein [Bacillota bacterium]
MSDFSELFPQGNEENPQQPLNNLDEEINPTPNDFNDEGVTEELPPIPESDTLSSTQNQANVEPTVNSNPPSQENYPYYSNNPYNTAMPPYNSQQTQQQQQNYQPYGYPPQPPYGYPQQSNPYAQTYQQTAYVQPVSKDTGNIPVNSENPYAGNFYGNYGQPPKKKTDKSLKLYILGIIILIIAFITGIIFFANNYKVTPQSNNNQSSTGSNSNNAVNPNGPSLSINGSSDTSGNSAETQVEAAFNKVSVSVVGVVVYEDASDKGTVSKAAGQGSGIIMSSDGYIITNSHVISDSKKYTVQVVTSTKKTYDATIVGYDTRTDLAVLKINTTG